MPDTNIFAIFGLPTGRIYSIVSAFYLYLTFADEVPDFKTLMSTLNMRGALRDVLSEPRIVCFSSPFALPGFDISIGEVKFEDCYVAIAIVAITVDRTARRTRLKPSVPQSIYWNWRHSFFPDASK